MPLKMSTQMHRILIISAFENRRCRYKEFSKSEAEAYLLYAEHSLLRNDAVDASHIFKREVDSL